MLKETKNETWDNIGEVRAKLFDLLDDVLDHSGFGEIRVDVKVLKGGKKEVVISSGKQYRFVLKQNTSATD
jgi:hypothetical protein